MELRREDFPITLQAYHVHGNQEDFVAEQVVSSQAEADNFMTMYAGKLIKTADARLHDRDVRHEEARRNIYAARRRATVPAWAIILVVLVVLLIVAYATGWLQTMLAQLQ